MANTTDKLYEDEADRIALKIAQQIHEKLPATLQDDVRETPIAMCAKSLLASPEKFNIVLGKAECTAARELEKEGSVNVSFGKFRVKYLGTPAFEFRPLAVRVYAERLTSENPLELGHPLTLEQAVNADIYTEIVMFLKVHHTEEDIVEGDGGSRPVEAEPEKGGK
jgi:hypothetical protein